MKWFKQGAHTWQTTVRPCYREMCSCMWNCSCYTDST